MSTFTEKDLERAAAWLKEFLAGSCRPDEVDVAWLIAEVREECAKVCASPYTRETPTEYQDGFNRGVDACAKRIRELGK